jgi:hypothetical protein
MDNLEQTADVIDYLLAAYPRNEPPKATQAVYLEMLEDIDPARLLIAAKKHIAESVFFPSIAELRAAANSIETLADDAPALERAWPLAQKYATNVLERRVMEYGVNKMEVHPRIKRAVEAIGAERIWENDNPSALFAQFRDAYANLTKQDQQAPLLPAVQAEIARVAAARRMDAPQIEASKAAKKHPDLYEVDEDAVAARLAVQSEAEAHIGREWMKEILSNIPQLNSATVSDPVVQKILREATGK